jgi:hypothetical protein
MYLMHCPKTHEIFMKYLKVDGIKFHSVNIYPSFFTLFHENVHAVWDSVGGKTEERRKTKETNLAERVRFTL